MAGKVGRTLLVLLLVATGLVCLTVGAWALDTQLAEGEPLRNVEIAGRPVGGLNPAALDATLQELAEEYPASEVEVTTPDGSITLQGAEVGLALDVEATAGDVLAVGRQGSVSSRFTSWAGALLAPRTSTATVTVERALVEEAVVERDPTGRVEPTEPGIAVRDGALVTVPGVAGEGLDPVVVGERVAEEAATGELPVVVTVEPAPVPPRFADADADRLTEQGRQLTEAPLVVQAGDTSAEVPGATVQTWFRAVPAADGLRLDADRGVAAADLEAILGDVGADPTDATFRIEGGRVVIVPGSSGTDCCAAEAGDLAVSAVFARPEGALELPLTEEEPTRTTAEAEALGIVEPVGTFTTSFPAGQSRVQNIHRMSDLTRGVVIEPGGSFSVNDFVGRRTEANGFTTGGVIQDGVFDESVGGGISQYATTLFNAAFFGGLEYGTYQSHSIYITRYPFGREATLSFPQPDLVIENPTPHGVLIWPTYTASSVTVTLYSTPWARGEQTGQTRTPVGACTRVTTERTRTFMDGRTERDSVFATYRPEEGVDC